VWGYYKVLTAGRITWWTPTIRRIQFNGLIDRPFGRGKRWVGNSNRALDEVMGGWQLAGAGRIRGNRLRDQYDELGAGESDQGI